MRLRPEALFSVLTHPLRLRAMLLLHGQPELCVCELTHVLQAQQPVMSRHLAQLRRAGLVASRRAGVWIHYRLADGLPAWVTGVLDAAAAADRTLATDMRRLLSMKGRPEHGCGARTAP